MKCKFLYYIAILSASLLYTSLHAQQTLFIDKIEYSCASSFDISVRTKNITNTVALQGTVTWDTSVLKFNSINFGNAAITLNETNVNTGAATNGYLTFLWYDNDLTGKTNADSSTLFVVNFINKHAGKGKSNISFSNTPTLLEIDTLAAGGNPVNNTSALFTNGYVVTPSFYTFIRSGNWSDAANWQNNLVPPATLPACSEITINPESATECILNVQQNIEPGAKINLVAGKKFRIQGNMVIQ